MHEIRCAVIWIHRSVIPALLRPVSNEIARLEHQSIFSIPFRLKTLIFSQKLILSSYNHFPADIISYNFSSPSQCLSNRSSPRSPLHSFLPASQSPRTNPTAYTSQPSTTSHARICDAGPVSRDSIPNSKSRPPRLCESKPGPQCWRPRVTGRPAGSDTLSVDAVPNRSHRTLGATHLRHLGRSGRLHVRLWRTQPLRGVRAGDPPWASWAPGAGITRPVCRWFGIACARLELSSSQDGPTRGLGQSRAATMSSARQSATWTGRPMVRVER